MAAALILLIIITGGGALLYIHDRLTRPKDESGISPPSKPEAEDAECCGMHITCEKDSLVAGIDGEIIYYDDEELDRFRGRGESDYADAEIEEFREVLLTLRPEEIAGWARSVVARGIAMPSEVREELMMIVAEARKTRM